jgi:hypothetical protein
MPLLGRVVKRRAPTFVLTIHITARINELLRDGLMPTSGRGEERRASILCLKIDVTARINELLRDGLMPTSGRPVERRVPLRALVVDERLRAFFRQQRANLRCITARRGFTKMLPRHSFPAPSLCFSSLFPCEKFTTSLRLNKKEILQEAESLNMDNLFEPINSYSKLFNIS